MRVSAPNFEQLERLNGTRDADLIARRYVDPALNRGRGAQTNKGSRFDRQSREEFDDGWGQVEDLKPFETIEHVERAKSIITRNESPDIGFDRSINAYRGCEHGCSYCFARPTHAYLGHSAGLEFERDIYVKANAVELLRRELADKRYKPKPIAMGTNTDPYQPAERQHKLTRGILELLLETKHPVTITTKSALVVRDLDILKPLAEQNLVRVALSITSMDHILSRKMEPRASTPEKRLEAMRLLSEAGIPTTVMAAPMIPAINDMELERILDAAAAQGAVGANAILLRLPGEVRDIFREWLLRHFPDRVSHVMSLVRDTRGGKDNDPNFGTRFVGEGPYATLLRQRVDLAKARYKLDRPIAPLRTDLFTPPTVDDGQMTLF
ncbi:DNA repair photolyase [Devosia sp. Root413D1]|uniref:PA0069 family radical SAM protein n=1 Tax=unclassified Devosia TaxID=196773 RepID=UPI0006FB03AD|nr:MULTISPECIES: PA0069 family radical SAM protein [unclassified Devosia]KQU94063.1 DNA repair photolyase [Devosia sp. Root105]KQW80170.1 DNA repair photolyase [Devosia sp. Root413D1]